VRPFFLAGGIETKGRKTEDIFDGITELKWMEKTAWFK